MIAQIATLVCAAAMALSLSVEAGSFFHSPASTSADSPSASAEDEPAADERSMATRR